VSKSHDRVVDTPAPAGKLAALGPAAQVPVVAALPPKAVPPKAEPPGPETPEVVVAPAPAARRTIDTSLLPLTVDTVAMPKSLGVHAGYGGGIAVVGDTIVIVDLKGAFFTVKDKGDRIERLTLPALSNHEDDYDRFARKPIQLGEFRVNAGFRVHDVESRSEPGGIRLFVSYERYLREANTTALTVSSILLDAKDLLPLGSWQDVYQSRPLAAEWYSGVAGAAAWSQAATTFT
jgi:hypothetical protein